MKPWFDHSTAGRSASRWFARLRSENVSLDTDAAFGHWLERKGANAEELERREVIWDLLGDLKDDPATAEMIQETAQRARQPQRRAWSRGPWSFAAAAAVAGLAVIGYRQLSTPSARVAAAAPAFERVFTTNPGEQKRITLPDGSQIALNTGTRVRARLSDKVRLLTLEEGEALFFVQRDVTRPFEVAAGETRTRALGTTFNVMYLHRQAGISVLDGRVQVEAGSTEAPSRAVVLSRGEGTSYSPQDGLGPVGPADVARISSWQAQRVEFHDVALIDAVNDFNRYSSVPIVIEDPALEGIRVSGVFHFDDVEAFRKTLHAIFGIRSRDRGSGVLLLPAAEDSSDEVPGKRSAARDVSHRGK